ncbi:hypothetical protein [Haloarchaeobius sp. HRN-SO-5]|uniref:hypothetical protein n=1 Tax=Haloarchaeobius sp. HRN-SO-5 TaxID=3446118 RepID=UPI003EB9FE1A
MSFKETHLDDESRWRVTVQLVSEWADEFFGVFRGVCFWMAIAIPFLWASLLVQGISTGAEFVAFSVMITVNVLALVVGHGHDPGARR